LQTKAWTIGLSLALVLFVCPVLLCLQAQARDLTIDELRQAASLDFGLTEFKDEFSSILKNLVEQSWDESGDWKGDIQGDATYFAPMLLYALWKDTGAYALRSMADKTVDHEVAMVYKFIIFPVPTMDLVIGFPSLAETYRATKRKPYLNMFTLGVSAGSMLATYNPDFFAPYMYDRASTYGAIIVMCFTAYELTGEDAYKKEGLALISQADRECWNEEKGLYTYSHYADWPQATMMMACAAAYRATGSKEYIERAARIIATMDERFWDKDRGGYSGHPTLSSKGLSGNCAIAWALLDLYEATGEVVYLEKVRTILKWILSAQLYDSQTHIIHHHYEKGTGRTDTFCTGCNFYTLCIIHRLNRLAALSH
jgi:rhamnogalacturonyl hydrolase YesR